jgi:uncharacterized protein (DUF2267 family)
VFDRTLQETNIWLDEVMEDIGPDRQRAYHVLRAVPHTLRDRLTVEEAPHLSAQLPISVRGIHFEGGRPTTAPGHERTRADFLEKVAERMRGARPANPEDGARAVLSVLSRHVSEGEIAQVKSMLPRGVAALWP